MIRALMEVEGNTKSAVVQKGQAFLKCLSMPVKMHEKSAILINRMTPDYYFPPSKLNNPPAILPSSREPPPGVCGAAANTRLASLENGND